MIRVILADDHGIFQQGLKHLINQFAGMTVIGAVSSGKELLEQLASQQTDVVVLGFTLRDQPGLETLMQMKKEFPKVAVLLLTMHLEEQFAGNALRAGALGYLTRSTDLAILEKAINSVATGQMFATPAMSQHLESALDREPSLHAKLSPREFQVFCRLAAGKGLVEIGKELGISMKTVSVFRTKILEKTGLKNNVEIARYAVRMKLLDA